MSAETFCACTHGVYVHTMDGCAVKGCGCTKYVPVHETDRRSIQEREDAARRAGFTAAKIEALAEIGRAREEALVAGFADCEALVSAMLHGMADHLEAQAKGLDEKDPRYARAWNRSDVLRQAALAVSLGQHRSAEVNERAIVAAHREAAGFNSSKAGGEARSRALSPERRREIAAAGGKGKKAFGKLSPAQRRFLARAQAENGTFYLADEDAATPQRASGWWRTARSLAKRGAVEKVSGVNAYKLTKAARARWAAKKGE